MIKGWLAGRDVVTGMLVYTAGDTLAAAILDEFAWPRVLGVMLVGGVLYAVEVPAWFRYIDRRFPRPRDAGGRLPLRAALARTLFALAYFNPLWIARHLLFLRVFSGAFDEVGPGLLRLGGAAFLAAVPVAAAANFLIQVAVPLRWRFAASACFSGLMATYYALSAQLVG